MNIAEKISALETERNNLLAKRFGNVSIMSQVASLSQEIETLRRQERAQAVANAGRSSLPENAATASKQTEGNTSLSDIADEDFATQTTLAALLSKVIAAPASRSLTRQAHCLKRISVIHHPSLLLSILGIRMQNIVMPYPCEINLQLPVLRGI